MMKLTLHKFKCWDNLTLEIPTGAIVLLKGPSGGGKTTVLKALAWVLYGQVKKTSPHLTTNAKTYVKYEYNDVTITRSKHPNKLIYDDGTIYEDSEAQSKINFLYGEYDVWLSTSYVPQRLQNHFLITSNVGKMELLNKIAFHEQDPNDYLEKIEKHYNEARSKQQYHLENYEKKLEQIDIYDFHITKYALSPSNIEKLENQLIKLKEKEKLLIKMKNKQDIDMAIKKNKEDEYASIIINDIELSLQLSFNFGGQYKLNEETFLMLENKYKEFKNNYDISEKKNALKIKLKSVDQIAQCFTLVDLQESIQKETTYYENDVLFKQLDLTHDIEEINDYIDYLNHLLESQERLSKQKQLDELISKILPNTTIDYSIYDISNLQNNIDASVLEQGSLQHQLQHLIESQNSIPCPYCEKEVLYKNGQLTKVTMVDNTDIDTVNEKLSLIKNQIVNDKKEILRLKSEESKIRKENEEQINTQQYLEKEIEKLKREIEKLPITDCEQLLSTKEKENVYKTLLKLKNIKIVSLPKYKSEEIKTFFKNKEEYDKQQQLLEQYNALPDFDYIVTLNDLEILEKFIKNYQIQFNLLTTHQQRKQVLESQIANMMIEEVEDVEIIKKQISKIEEQINQSKIAHEMINQHDLLSQERDLLLELTNKANYLGELKQIASDIECRVLEGVVNTISSHVYDVCQNMFDQELKMDIHLYKQLKSARVKPCVNFKVLYKGGKYDSPFDLSPGEQDRTSIAMMLALSRISTVHIIMIDETLKSLNIELQIDVIKNIRENCNSTVFIVDHDGLEGLYDHIIDVDQLDQFKIICS